METCDEQVSASVHCAIYQLTSLHHQLAYLIYIINELTIRPWERETRTALWIYIAVMVTG